MHPSPPRRPSLAVPSSATLSPAVTTSLSPFAAPQPELVSSPHLEIDQHRLVIPKNVTEEREKARRSEQSEEIHSAARRLRKRLPKRGGARELSELVRMEGAFVRGKPLITSTRTLLLIDDALEVSTPEDPAHPRPAVVALCSDVIVIGFKMIPKDEKLYFDWRLEGQRIMKLTRCEVVQDSTTHLITLTTPLTTLFIHPTSPSTSTLYPTLLTLLTPAPSSALPLTPPASPSPNSPTSPTLSTSSSSTSAKAAPTRRRAPPPSSFHTRPVSQASAHSAHSTQSVSSIRSVSSFRAGWEPVWVKDEDCVGCQECGEGWTWSRRRHHCRACGRLICHACSSFVPSIFGSTKPMRACTTCSAAIDESDSEDEDAEFGVVHHRHQQDRSGGGTSEIGLGIYGDGEDGEEGSDDEGTVKGTGDDDRGSQQGLGEVAEEEEDEKDGAGKM